MDFHRLSVRTGKREPSGPYEGVPPHLVNQLITWIRDGFGDQASLLGRRDMLHYIAMINELAVSPGSDERDVLGQLLDRCVQDPDFCLDVLDSMLKFGKLSTDVSEHLGLILMIGGSVWDVAPGGDELMRRVDPSAVDQFILATSPADTASTELHEAWSKTYGRQPDASDAWDHAIKAAEAILIPIVCPTKDKANLGSVAGDLKAQPGRWKLLLHSNGAIGSVETLEAMLRFLWPNPDRHAGRARRTPTIDEAQATVQLC